MEEYFGLKIGVEGEKECKNSLPKRIKVLPRMRESIIRGITNKLPRMIEMGIKLIVELAVGLEVGSVFDTGQNSATNIFSGAFSETKANSQGRLLY